MNNFEIIGLYLHNIESCRKVQKQFDDGAKIVSIIHATRTGKSYNGLYLALEYKDKKIVWIVTSNAIKEHILKIINDNPNLDLSRDFPNLEIRTYQSLINLTKKEIENIDCEFLIIDELHHLGAPICGERVKTFIDSHPDIIIFGMSAYSVRDREPDSKQKNIEKLISPLIIDFIEELETKDRELEWQRMYELLKAYRDHHKNTEVPYKFKTTNGYEYDETGYALGIWCNYQRINQLKLSKERRKKLEIIGFRLETKDKELEWQRMYELLKAYRAHHKNTEVPYKFKTTNGYEYDETGYALGTWCNYQRKNLSNLSEDRKQKLKKLGFRLETSYNESEWQRMYELLEVYYCYHGDTEVPYKFKTKEGYALGVWCNTQRKNLPNLSEDRKQKLLKLGFRLETKDRESEWQRMYELLEAHYKYYGDAEVPSGFKTKNGYEYDKTGDPLGLWCVNQRRNRFNLSEDRRKKLETIEFRFGTKKECEEKKKILCNEYCIDYDKIIRRISYIELYAKIQYLIENNYSVVIGGRLHEIFSMSNENMMLKYLISKEELILRYYINNKGRGK